MADVGIGGCDEIGLLLTGDRGARWGEATDTTCLDLDDDQRLAPLSDEVDLLVQVAPVACVDGIALRLEVAAG